MRIAITGTPGVGKSALAAQAEAQGHTVVAVGAWAREIGAVAGRDDADDADVLDLDILAAHVTDTPADCFFDGHLSHLLPLDAAWVIRCDPLVLRQRLAARGYAAAKVDENVEAEAIDLILQEALAHQARVVQRDGTQRSPQELWSAFAGTGLRRLKGTDLEPVDWSDRLL